MEVFPDDLVAGVYPLVFAINAILSDATTTNAADSSGAGENTAANLSSPRRTRQFDKFLDAMAACMMEAGPSMSGGNLPESSGLWGGRSTSGGVEPIGEEEDSDDDDEEEVPLSHSQRSAGGGIPFSPPAGLGFGRLKRGTSGNANSPGHERSLSNGWGIPAAASGGSSAGPTTGLSFAFARALAQGQSFFERARMQSYGTHHGFPPSKDPEGTNNVVHELTLWWKSQGGGGVGSGKTAAKTSQQRLEKLTQLFQQHPINGILPSGWLEKHVHALPSVIVVVCSICNDPDGQTEQDQHLFQTIEHLAYSLAPKRDCQIHIVGLLDEENVTAIQGDAWLKTTLLELKTLSGTHDFHVTLLHGTADVQAVDSGLPASPNLRQLHQDLRDASLKYYQAQTRRCKDKLAKLMNETKRRRGTEIPPDPILPLVIRYCVKMAFFYEFQLRHEKSLRFFHEAYRHNMNYYEYLRSNPKRPDSRETQAALEESASNMMAQQHSVTADAHDSVEVELALDTMGSKSGGGGGGAGGPFPKSLWRAAVNLPPSDMIHQCRAVAEWLNLKLLTAALGSHTAVGRTVAVHQWREHQRSFFGSLVANIPGPPSTATAWLEWSYVARQRIVLLQLLERHNLSSSSGGPALVADSPDWGLDSITEEEVGMLFSPWRTAQAAVEALLRTAREMDRLRVSGVSGSAGAPADRQPSEDTSLRNPFIGGLDSEGLAPKFREEVKISHREKALELAQKAITLYEAELEAEKRGFFAEESGSRSTCRDGARMYYLTGGILLGMNRHQEAMGYLETASKFSRGWRDLERAVRKLLIECYEKHMPADQALPSPRTSVRNQQTLASMILDSYFGAEMSSQDLRRALRHFSTLTGGNSLKWYHEFFNDEDPNLPFSFEVTFPENIFATIGDTVKAAVLIKSNLDYAIHVNSVVLLSLAGKLPISSNDLMSATNASEGSDGGIIIQKNGEITITTEITLPKDLSIIASDDSGNGGELQGIAGKGSFAKSARPRTAGLTSAGGARLLSASQLSRENKVTQGWSLRFLGGKPLKCDGLCLNFYPVQVGKDMSGSEQVTMIELTIEKKKPRTAADIKRTPFEEENYIASAWSRPQRLPFHRGPRSLRVLGPQPQMVITNLTDGPTDGKALEGTVNRVILKLQAGLMEECSDVTCKVSCFSVLVFPEGNTKRLVEKDKLNAEAETSVDMTEPQYRTPVVVSSDSSEILQPTDYGFNLPRGWKLAGNGQGFQDHKIESLKGGESTFMSLDFYRPPSAFLKGDEAEKINSSLCKTDFYVTVTYRQTRPSSQRRSNNRTNRAKRVVRRRPGRGGVRDSKRVGGSTEFQDESSAPEAFATEAQAEPSQELDEKKDETDVVSLEYSGAIVWMRPMMAIFSPGIKTGEPSGMEHASNFVEDSKSVTGAEGEGDPEIDFVAVDGETVAAKCALSTETSASELRTEVVGVHYRATTSPDAVLTRTLKSSDSMNSQQLYKAAKNDQCRILKNGSLLSVAFSVKVNLIDPSKQTAKDSLGRIAVEWSPFPLELPLEASQTKELLRFSGHGPLRLDHPSLIEFEGPLCHVQKAPFSARFSVVPSSASIVSPFEVEYVIENQTFVHQKLSLKMAEQNSTDGDLVLLVSGMIEGDLVLGPQESQRLKYTMIATRPGRATLPPLSVSSARHKTWVVHHAAVSQFPLYVFP